MSSTLHVRLFGGIDLADDQGTPVRLPTRGAGDLLAYVLLNRRMQLVRESLVGAFWPDLPENLGRRRLSQALWRLGKVWPAPEPLLHATRDTIELNPEADIWVDVFEFESRLALRELCEKDPVEARVADLSAAVELYRGELLAGRYHDWVLIEQERLKQQYLTAVVELSRLLKSAGDIEGALAHARLLTRHAPLREEGHREVMRLSHLLGRTHEAVEQYQVCCEVLDTELGVEPEDETVALYARLSAPEAAPPRTEPAARAITRPDFVGRTGERSVLIGSLEDALAGRGTTLLVEGDVGVGKSRLVEQMADDAQWRGFDVATGSCAAVSPPFSAVTSVLDAALTRLRVLQLSETVDGVWLREVSRLMPELDQWLPDLPAPTDLELGDNRARMQEALARTLVASSRVKPLLVVIEDLHHGDGDTLLVLRALATFVPTAPLVVCMTFRGDEARQGREVWDALRDLDRVAATGRLALAPLDASDTARLVRNAGGDLSADVVAEVHAETGGNPLFVLETLRALTDDAAAASAQQLPIASTVHELITQRVERTSPRAQRVLRAMAVNPGPIGLDAVSRIGGLSTVDASAGMEEALQRALAVDLGEAYGFAQEQVRRVVYRGASRSDLLTMHGRAGDLLERARPGALTELAHHFSHAERWVQSAEYNRLAALEAVEARSYARAADHYELSIDAARRSGSGFPGMAQVVLDYESVLDVLGRRDDQVRALEDAEDLEGTTVEILRRRSLLLAQVDRFEEAVEVAEHAAQLAGRTGDGALVGVQTALGRILTWWGRAADALAPLEAATAAAGDDGDGARAELALGTALADVQDYERATAALERARDLYSTVGEPQGLALALGGLARVSMEQGRTAAARAAYVEALARCEEIGYRYGEGVNSVNLGNLLQSSGELTGAFECYAQAIAVFRSLGNRRGEALTSLNSATVRNQVFGHDDRAVAEAQTALAFSREVGDVRGQAQSLEVLGSLAISSGDLPEARRHLLDGLDNARGCDHHWLEVQNLLTLGRLELEAGDAAAALGWLRPAIDICARDEIGDLTVQVRSLQGLAWLMQGSTDEALTASRQAVAGLKSGVVGPHLIWWAHHLVAGAAGHTTEAAGALTEAHEALERLLAQLGPDDRIRSRDGIPAHRLIQDSWAGAQPRRVEFEVPVVDAPTGRPLRDHELITVQWTLTHPDDDHVVGVAARRRHRVLRLTAEAGQQGAAPTVEDLAAALEVSRSTIRRDLAELRAAGHDVRTRGTRTAS